MASKLATFAKKSGIKYFLINFTDLCGIQRSKLVPTQAIAEMEAAGAGFAGFATYLDMTPAHPDMFAVPDPSSVIQIPWKPEVAWVAGDLVMNQKPLEQAPRVVLKRLIKQAQKKGFWMKTGVEAEYFLISENGTNVADPRDIDPKPCYDQSVLMRRFDIISEICNSMISLGWRPYQNDHEDGNGQFEMNWEYADSLVTADRHAFFKFMVKAIAEKHGLRATFMPKPFINLTGNGCHIHVSIWDKTNKKNLFYDRKGDLGISKLGYSFLGGILRHATALAAITNPTVNSYKRLNAPVTISGATWSPNSVTWSGNNRTHMVRIPDQGRFEIRLADGAVNPYLLNAGVLAAGLHGIETEADPGKRLDIDMYAEATRVESVKLPGCLLDAIREFQKNKVLRVGLGEEFSDAYVKIKMEQWNQFCRSMTPWERENTLDC